NGSLNYFMSRSKIEQHNPQSATPSSLLQMMDLYPPGSSSRDLTCSYCHLIQVVHIWTSKFSYLDCCSLHPVLTCGYERVLVEGFDWLNTVAAVDSNPHSFADLTHVAYLPCSYEPNDI
uniref:Uncharacterized protein n=1 Tax=Aegilops tauschii subsp. strangulata TaxID=200361 RepID=A0A453CN08_AEGTS